MPSFNQFMHPRNPYKERTDFADLAAQYPALQPFLIPCVHRNDKVTIDFGNPEALRALTQGLFKCHRGLDVQLPRDRLIPAIPQRLNYILWLEDLINDLIDMNYEDQNRECIRGIDIGTGASCVFPLLICRRNPSWHMLALESDAMSAQVALSNIKANQLAEKISLVNCGDCLSHLRREKVREEDASSVEAVNIPHFHFTICNPPFFISQSLKQDTKGEDEIQIEEQDDCDGTSDYNDDSKSSLSDAIVARQVTRAKETGKRRTHKSQRCKSSGNTSCDNDSITHGGEVGFVKRLIAQSAEMAHLIDLFTVMLGSKESLIALKRELNAFKEENDQLTFNWTLFCQGRVIRWGLVWSFTKNLHSSSVERICSHKLPKKSSEWAVHLPPHATPLGLDQVAACTDLLVDILIHSLHIKTFHIIKSTPHTSVIIIKSNVNTWSHQRRKRRQLQREQNRVRAASSQANQPANGHQSHLHHAEDTQQDEMVIETMQGTVTNVQEERKLSGSMAGSLTRHSPSQNVGCVSARQLMSSSPESDQCLSMSSSCCKRKVDQMNSLNCSGDGPVIRNSPLTKASENRCKIQYAQPGEKSFTFHGGEEEEDERMEETACNMRLDHSDYPAGPSEFTFDVGYKKGEGRVAAVSSHPRSSSSSRASLSNDQSYKKSRDGDGLKSKSDVCAKGQSSGKWVKLHKHDTCSVQNEKVDDILYLLHCTVRIVKEIDSCVKLIVVNNENSLDHESAYQLFQYLRNRLLSPLASCSK